MPSTPEPQHHAPAARSMERMRVLLVEHGWTIKADHSAMVPTTMPPGIKRHHVGRITAEKAITFGLVRMVISWENGRFTEAMIGRDGYATAYVIPTVRDVRSIIADPGAGFVFHVEEVRAHG